MLTEIAAATSFLASLLPLDDPTRLRFRTSLAMRMAQKYESSWHPTHPSRGNGFRALGVFGGRPDTIIMTAAEEVGLSKDFVVKSLPNELVLWVDPFSVSFRAGEYGFPTTIWEDRKGEAMATGVFGLPQQQGYSRSSKRVSLSPSPPMLPYTPSITPPLSDASSTTSTSSSVTVPHQPQGAERRQQQQQYRKSASLFPVLVS